MSRAKETRMYAFDREFPVRFGGAVDVSWMGEVGQMGIKMHGGTGAAVFFDPQEARRIADALTHPSARPTIVCLCGSTRFWRTFQEASLRETLAGRIVLSIGAASGTDDEHFGNLPLEDYDRVKADLDRLHLRKVEMADEVLILNVGGYVGESTSRELAHAVALGKRVRWWEDGPGAAVAPGPVGGA